MWPSSIGTIKPAIASSSSTIKLLTTLSLLTLQASAQSIQQPTSNTSITSFSGQGSIPFSFTSSSGSDTSSINIALVQDGITYDLANGLLPTSGDDARYQAVFAPLSGFCGDVSLQVFENQGNTTSSDPTSVSFTISCGPVQRTKARRALSLERRQDSGGPSGSLNTPSGGTSYNSPDDPIRIVYQPVTEGGQTFGIDALLTSDLGNYTLVNGLWKQNSSSDISASFAIPSGACGPFNLQITEHQFYQNGAIQFQAASPSINISCPSSSDNGNTNATLAGNLTSTAPISTSTSANNTAGLTNATSTTTANATSTITSTSILPSNTTTSTIPTNTTSLGVSSTTITSGNNTSASTSMTASANVTTTTTFVTSNSTTLSAASTNSTSSTTSSAPPSFTGNITLPIETSTITRPTTIVSTVTTTFTQSGQEGTVTSVVTTTISPSSTSTSSNSTSSSTSTSSTSTSTSTTTTSGGGGGGGIRTTTVTQTPSSQGNGITTVTVTPSTSPTSGTVTRQTSTYTTTEVVVVAQPGRSSITSTRLQTVILVSQTIAAIVAPSSSGGNLNTNTPSGAGLLGAVVPWTLTIIAGLVSSIALLGRVL